MPLLTPPALLNSSRWAGLRVGLLGGSFNPPHEGHVHISLAAMKGLTLDAIWWLVTPQNPLKTEAPLPLAARMAQARALIRHPRIIVSDLEVALGTTVTYDSIRKLKRSCPRTNFVWISGMDNALTLHEWQHWRGLLAEICMLHLTRSPAKSLVKGCPLRMYRPQRHIVLEHGGRYPLDSGTTYWMMQNKMVNVSSTDIRRKQAEKTGG